MEFIAHRGASAHAPENTLASFKKALEMKARFIELDIAESRDGRLVVIHDDNLKRVAGMPGRVETYTAAQLKKMDVGSWFSERYAQEGVPTLEDVFELVGRKAEINVEMKGGCRIYPKIEEKLCRLLKRRALKSRVLISSFDHEALFHFRALDSRARIGYLLGRTSLSRAFEEMADLKAESLNLSARQVSAQIVSQAHRKGFKVLAYTVNKIQEARRLAKIGVDGIFTNFPEMKNEF